MALILPVRVYSWPCVCSSYFLRLIWFSGVTLKMYTMLWICWVFEKLLWRSSAYFSPLQSGKQFCSLAMIFNISHIYIWSSLLCVFLYLLHPQACFFICFWSEVYYNMYYAGIDLNGWIHRCLSSVFIWQRIKKVLRHVQSINSSPVNFGPKILASWFYHHVTLP